MHDVPLFKPEDFVSVKALIWVMAIIGGVVQTLLAGTWTITGTPSKCLNGPLGCPDGC